jgi:Domain of unknown function (DUF6468)
MSDIGLIMNGLLGLLLTGALVVGWRLEGRLKVLRASQQSFTTAVQDLDRAAARAEQGLADLRAATDEAADSLAARIERAAALVQRLEKSTADALGAEARLAASPRPAPPSREAALQRFSERYGATKAAAAPTPLAQAAARNDLILEDEPRSAKPAPERPAASDRLERLRALARPRPDAAVRTDPIRPAARIDDELFDAPEPRRMAAGGGR